MSSLADRVTQEMKTSMKARNKSRTTALRMIRAKIIEAEKEGKGELNDARVISILRSIAKQRRDSADQYRQGEREDLAEAELAELAIVEEFLPQLADEATTQGWVDEAIASTGASSMRELGKVMGSLMKQHKAEMDAGLARRLIEKALS